MNSFVFDMMAKERHKDMLQEANRLRLVSLYEANNPPQKAKLLVALGDLLIQVGEKLKQRNNYEADFATGSCSRA